MLVNTKILRETYQNERYDKDLDENLNFTIFSHSNLIYFGDVVKKEKWCEAMDEEIYVVEKIRNGR